MTKRMLLTLCPGLLALAVASAVSAQEGGTVMGRVTDALSTDPLAQRPDQSRRNDPRQPQ